MKKSNGDLRVCLDPSDLNKAIKRPRFPLPTIEEIMSNLSGARVFSLVDAKNGYIATQGRYSIHQRVRMF